MRRACRRHRFGTKAIRRPCTGSGGDGAVAPKGGGQVRRSVGLAVHRRRAAAGHRATGRRASGTAARRRRACTTSPVRSAQSLLHCESRPTFVVGSDIDPVRLAMARHNVGDVPLCRADALRPVTRDAVVLADPARRRSGRRRFDPRDSRPPLDRLLDVYRDRDLVVKCAPGIDFAELGDSASPVRSRSRRWTAACARRACGRRDWPSRACAVAPPCWTAPNRSPMPNPTTARWRRLGRWIVDPDGAVVRAGLVRHYAARHGLWQLDPRHRLPVRRPAARRRARLRGVRRARLQREAAASGAVGARCGAVEILVRGVDVDPDALRRRLKLRGSRQVSVVIARIGSGTASRATAFICRPSR